MPRTPFQETSKTMKPCNALSTILGNHLNKLIMPQLEEIKLKLELLCRGLVFLKGEVLYCKSHNKSKKQKRSNNNLNKLSDKIKNKKRSTNTSCHKCPYVGWSWMLDFPPRLIVNKDKKLLAIRGKIQECLGQICLYIPRGKYN